MLGSTARRTVASAALRPIAGATARSPRRRARNCPRERRRRDRYRAGARPRLRPAGSRGRVMSREPQLVGQTLVVIGGSSGIGLETARRAREEGADVIITARNPDRVHRVGLELGASIAAFDATDFEPLGVV